MPYDPKRHHRRSIRLANYDYTQSGAYFVTLCIDQRRPILGEMRDATMLLSPVGRIVERCWLALPRHFENVTLDAWVLMPDHLHGIIVIRNSGGPTMAEPAPPLPSHRPNGTHSGSLNAIVQNFKSVCTRKVNQLHRTPGAQMWQRDYYEHIIRDERALNAIRRYIDENPARYTAH